MTKTNVSTRYGVYKATDDINIFHEAVIKADLIKQKRQHADKWFDQECKTIRKDLKKRVTWDVIQYGCVVESATGLGTVYPSKSIKCCHKIHKSKSKTIWNMEQADVATKLASIKTMLQGIATDIGGVKGRLVCLQTTVQQLGGRITEGEGENS